MKSSGLARQIAFFISTAGFRWAFGLVDAGLFLVFHSASVPCRRTFVNKISCNHCIKEKFFPLESPETAPPMYRKLFSSLSSLTFDRLLDASRNDPRWSFARRWNSEQTRRINPLMRNGSGKISQAMELTFRQCCRLQLTESSTGPCWSNRCSPWITTIFSSSR